MSGEFFIHMLSQALALTRVRHEITSKARVRHEGMGGGTGEA
jgi:hypothetical protein